MATRRPAHPSATPDWLNRRIDRRRLLLATPGMAALAAGTFGFAPAGLRSAAAQDIVPITPEQPQAGIEPFIPDATYFPATGHNLKNPFYSLWGQLGGEGVVGPPISEERFDDKSGRILQYFRGITLAYDPLQEPAMIRPVSFTSAERQPYMPSSFNSASCLVLQTDCVIAPSGFTISGRFLRFWQGAGEAALLGNPISEAFDEDGSTRQVFENAVLEETTGGVRLYPAWAEIAQQSNLVADPAFRPAPPNGGEAFLVDSTADDGLNLRTAATTDADVLVTLPANAEFIAAPGDHGEWVPGYVDGFAGWVAAEWLTTPPPLPERSASEWKLDVWQGAALGETNVRAQPSTQSRQVDELFWGDDLEVTAWVKGEEVHEGADLWAQIGRDRYVYARNVGRNAPIAPTPVPFEAPVQGKWIDVNLTQQLMIAYEGRTAIRVCQTTTGMAGWETPPGWFNINWRVPNETMTSGAIGAERFFKLENVLFTQYFSTVGHAIHFAWWRTDETIGRPGSHGCLNLMLDDSRFYWDWAPVGTPVLTHY